MTKITFLFCLCSTIVLSQNISGTLYDDEAPITGAKIMNVTSKSITSTDANGNFEIYAKINDTLLFTSLFNHTKQFVVNESHLDGTQVFELKKIMNELDEVDLQARIASKEMDEEETTNTVKQQFKTDVEKNPHLYRRPNTNSGPIDIIEIGRRIKKLFKRKTPKESETVTSDITLEDLDTLFKNDKFFNDTFLVLDLNITRDFKHLFFAFCETKEIPSDFLNSDNKIYLIDKFLEYSKEFQNILVESQKH